jgi:hypothetical protein
MSHFWLNLIRIVYIVVAFLLGKDSTSCNFLTYFMYTMLRYPSCLYNRLILGSVFIFIFIFFFIAVWMVYGEFFDFGSLDRWVLGDHQIGIFVIIQITTLLAVG